MKKILVVEDNPANMKLFADILEVQKYHVLRAYDGMEAFDKLSKESCDLMVLDIQLPKLDGFSLLKKLKESNITCPKTIIVSACAMDRDKQTAKSLGYDNYITKPIDISNFLTSIKKLLGESK